MVCVCVQSSESNFQGPAISSTAWIQKSDSSGQTRQEASLPAEPSDLFILPLPGSIDRHFPSHRPPWYCTAMGTYSPLVNLYFMQGKIKRILPNTRSPATWQRYRLECASNRKRKGQKAVLLVPLAPGVALPFTFPFWKHTSTVIRWGRRVCPTVKHPFVPDQTSTSIRG